MKKVTVLLVMMLIVSAFVFATPSTKSVLYKNKNVSQLSGIEANAECLSRIFLSELDNKSTKYLDEYLKDVLKSSRGKLSSKDYSTAIKIVNLLKEAVSNKTVNNKSGYYKKELQKLVAFEKNLKKQYIALDGPLSNFEDKIEAGLGKSMFDSLLKQYPAGTPQEQAFVEKVSGKIFAEAKKQRKFGAYKVRVINMTANGKPVPNAFCCPGGYVFVTTALLKLVGNDLNEMAFIVGHESGHHISKDSMQKMKLALPLLPLKLISKKLVLRFIEAPIGRRDEYKADMKGCELTKKIGLDPMGGVKFLKVLTEAFGNLAPGPYGDHPSNSDRIKRIKKYLSSH